jgi:lipoprotein-anchoring transpeptidase ErfK/SrfK
MHPDAGIDAAISVREGLMLELGQARPRTRNGSDAKRQRRVRQAMTMRALAFVILSVALGGCMQDLAGGTVDPAGQAGWKPKDKALMSNLPYNQAAVPEVYRRHMVEYHRKEAPGTVVVDSDNKFLYYVLPGGKAIRYGVAVGEDAQAWSGIAKVGRMEEWPSARCRPTSPAGRTIRWARAGCTCTPATRTRFTVSTAPTSRSISAQPCRRAASA